MSFEERRPLSKDLTPLFSGMVFGVGWWLFISAHIVQSHGAYTPVIWAYYYIPGIIATFGMIILDGSSFTAIANPGGIGTRVALAALKNRKTVSARIRAWLFLSFALSFGAIIASVWIMAGTFLPPDGSVEHSWPGVALMLQNLLIFLASMILLWNKAVSSGEYEAF